MANPHSLRHTLQIDRHRLFNQAMDVSPGAGHGQVGMSRMGRTDGSHFDLRVGKQPFEVAVGPQALYRAAKASTLAGAAS